MKTVGIICEYNPFHNGHIYHINKIKKMFKDCLIVLILSGDFTQRGEVSLIDKWKKTFISLNYVDLVIELPFVFASQGADIFAYGACDILKKLNVDYLVFGSECNDIEKLKRLCTIQDTLEYNKIVKTYLNKGLNYPTSLAKALYDLSGETINTPNDLLGMCYIRNLKNSHIKCISIKRTNDYLDKNASGTISSATSIRNLLKEKKDISKYVPSKSLKYLNNVKFIDDYFDLIKYKIISEDISKYQTIDEGIENRFKKVINEVNTVDELISKVKSKRYTYNKIKRSLIHILLSFTKKEANNYNKIEYIRVLGFNKKGREYLNKIKKKCKYPIITNYKKDYKMLKLEKRISDIYNLKKKDDNLAEHQHMPIIR